MISLIRKPPYLGQLRLCQPDLLRAGRQQLLRQPLCERDDLAVVLEIRAQIRDRTDGRFRSLGAECVVFPAGRDLI